MKPLGEFAVSVVRQEQACLVSVEHRGDSVFRATVPNGPSVLPFRFDTDEGPVLGLVSANEKNAALYRGGTLLARSGSSLDFRKIEARVFGATRRVDLWDLYTVLWNALIGALSGAALVFGLFLSPDLGMMGLVALVVFLVSFAIERARDRQAVTFLRQRLDLEA